MVLHLSRMLLTGVVRSRGYLVTIAAGVGLVLISLLLNELGGTESWRVLADVGVFFVGVTTATIAGGNTLFALTSVEQRQQLQVLATRPIPREALFLANVLAGWAIAVVTATVLAIVLTGIGALSGIPGALRFPVAVAVASVEGFVVVALAAALASASSRAVAGPVTVALYALLRLGPAAADLRSVAASSFRYVPRLDRFSLSAWVNEGPLPDDIVFRLAFAAVFSCFLVAVGMWRFSSTDIARR